MEKFIGTILTIIIIFYVVRILFRLLMPLLLKIFVGKMQKRFEQQFEYDTNNSNYSANTEGDVIVENTNRRKTNKKGQTLSDELGGEYVDFEEVK